MRIFHSKFIKGWVRWFAVCVWAGLIWYLSGIPHLKTDLGVWDLILRKIAHITEYAILFVLLLRAWMISSSADEKKIAWICLALSVVYAVSDEFHQSFVPGRHGSSIDIMIDSTGALLGMLMLRYKKIAHIIRGT